MELITEILSLLEILSVENTFTYISQYLRKSARKSNTKDRILDEMRVFLSPISVLFLYLLKTSENLHGGAFWKNSLPFWQRHHHRGFLMFPGGIKREQ